jgi:hypothetical protein
MLVRLREQKRHAHTASSDPDHSRKHIVNFNWAESLRKTVHRGAESLGNLFVDSFHYLALFAIGGVTAWGAVMAFIGMLEKGHIAVDDILLLFIYLELGAMVGIYFKTKVYVTNIPSSGYQMVANHANAGPWGA